MGVSWSAVARIGPALLLAVAILVVWQLGVTASGMPQFILPSPLAIIDVLIRAAPLLLRNLVVTLQEFGYGLGASVFFGIALGVATAKSRAFAEMVYPVLIATQSVPKLALAPLFTVWFGFGLLPKVLIAFLIAFFPITVNTAAGLLSTDPNTLLMARSIGLSTTQRFFKVELPNALPAIFAGLKVGTAFAVVGSVVGEFLGADAGLGRVTLTASTTLDTPLLFAALTVLAALGLASYGIVASMERLLIPWHAEADDAATFSTTGL
jgi:NitT/TauT family transport system permease protein